MSTRSPGIPREHGATLSGWFIAHGMDVVGVAIAAIALWHTTLDLWTPILPYDEGILLTDANLILHGQVPYRDFYSNYPPGIFLVIAGLWKLSGVSVLAYRALGFALHLMVAALAGRLAGRISGRQFVWLAAGLTLTWIESLKGSPTAYLTAVGVSLLGIELLLRAMDLGRSVDPGRTVDLGRSRVRWLAAGLALGAVSCFRHDLFIFVVFALGAMASWAVWRRRLVLPREARWIAIGIAIPLLGMWVPTIARAGLPQVVADLYWDQVHYVLPARSLPIPALFRPGYFPRFDCSLPPFLLSQHEAGIFLALIGPPVGVVAWILGRGPRLPLVFAVALAVAVVPHLLGRIDLMHTLYAVTPSIIVLCGLTDGIVLEVSRIRAHEGRIRGVLRALPSCLGVVWLVAVALNMALPIRRFFPPAKYEETLPRYYPLEAQYVEERRAVLDFIDEHTQAGDPIYVGTSNHARGLANEINLYFLADRCGATRYMQFDPNVVTRADVQRVMIAELERTKPEVAILTPPFIWFEANLSRRAGATLIDKYLKAQYRVVGTKGQYQLLLRN